MQKSTPRLSIVVIFFDMRREAARTLYSLSTEYQKGVDAADWEVIAIDNGSTKPLDPTDVQSFGDNFRYHYHATDSASPVEAINLGVRMARAENVCICIDGARILTPGIVKLTLDCFRLFPNPLVCTLGWHLGPDRQNVSMLEGYDQTVEDRLLASVDWRGDGYNLFDIAAIAPSARGGYFSPISESNCLSLSKAAFDRGNGFDERFTAPGGGVANLDFYNRMAVRDDMQLVHLLGEGTFHQFHGGVATNVPLNRHPRKKNRAQYKAIRGEAYARADVKAIYYGGMPEQARRFIGSLPTGPEPGFRTRYRLTSAQQRELEVGLLAKMDEIAHERDACMLFPQYRASHVKEAYRRLRPAPGNRSWWKRSPRGAS